MANLELYKIFIEVAKEKNITRASEKLHISQPAVTRHIKNLENELNIVLFSRTKGMELTELGKKLYNEISTSIEKIVDIDRKYCIKNEIILGTYSTMLSKVLSGPIAEFYSKNKDAKIITITDNSKILKEPLNSGELDILISRKFNEKESVDKRYKYISLGYFDFVLIANKKSELCQKKKIKINDLNGKIVYIPRGDSRATNSLKNLIENNKIDAEIKRIDSVTMSQIIQQFGDCVGEANTTYLKNEIEQGLFQVLDTDFKIPSTEIGIYYRKDNTSKELKNLIRIIKKKFIK